MNYEDTNFEYTMPENVLKEESSKMNKELNENENYENQNKQEVKNEYQSNENEDHDNDNDNDDILNEFIEDEKKNEKLEEQIQIENQKQKELEYISTTYLQQENKVIEEKTKVQESIKQDNLQEFSKYQTNNSLLSQNKYGKAMEKNLSKIQLAELKYDQLQQNISRIFEENSKIEELESKNDIENLSDLLRKQNQKLVKNLEEMIQILNIMIDFSNKKLVKEVKKPNQKNPQLKENKTKPRLDQVSTENKLVEVFRIEHRNLSAKINQISSENYESQLDENLKEITQEILVYENENKNLKLSQKQSEAIFERQSKNPKEKSVDLKKVLSEYQTIKKLNENLIEKIEKNKLDIEENERIARESNEKYEKNLEIADNYGIDEKSIKRLSNDNKPSNNDNKIQENIKISLERKCDIFDKASQTNKKKYEVEIARNIKEIFNLEKKREELYQYVKINTANATSFNKKVNQYVEMHMNSKLQQQNNTVKYTTNNENVTNNIKISENPEKNYKSASKSLVKKSAQEKKRKKNLGINSNDDDTYFTSTANQRTLNTIKEKDKEFEETLLKAKQFINEVQSKNLMISDSDNNKSQVLIQTQFEEEKIENTEDARKTTDLILEKYENLNKVPKENSGAVEKRLSNSKIILDEENLKTEFKEEISGKYRNTETRESHKDSFVYEKPIESPGFKINYRTDQTKGSTSEIKRDSINEKKEKQKLFSKNLNSEGPTKIKEKNLNYAS